MKIAGVTDDTNHKHFGWIKYLSPTYLKMRKYLPNVHNIGGVHVQCMNNHYAKFEY